MPFLKKKILQPPHLYVGPSSIEGRGVFSKRALAAGELVEQAPLILISNAEDEILKATALYHYYFVLSDKKTPVAIGLGYSSMYNHGSPANAEYKIDMAAQLIEIRTVKTIAADEEITINYNGRHDDASPIHFSAP